ncbi:MAG: Sua5/YciO/YrdC/YwlC family protein, partial [Desulfarculus sp.]|nr:Sua5/YciO/YrdC/YwlC family protein [Desulfarculus sp.]
MTAHPPRLILNPAAPDPEALARAADCLRQGGVTVFPTETLYGLGVDYHNHGALTRLARLKGREADKPFPLILAAAAEVDALAQDIPAPARELM